uniref:Uncharacterized protein n=1 Tax=Setaria italica TaxID=4555 RepID=K3YLZ2_SETIT
MACLSKFGFSVAKQQRRGASVAARAVINGEAIVGSSSAAEDAAERRLGRRRNASPRRRCCCEDDGGGRTRDASARLIWSPPSTAAMRTSGFAIDARRGALSLLDTGACVCVEAANEAAGWPLCRAQRKDPGCVVGEHAHDGARLRGGAGWGAADGVPPFG